MVSVVALATYEFELRASLFGVVEVFTTVEVLINRPPFGGGFELRYTAPNTDTQRPIALTTIVTLSERATSNARHRRERSLLGVCPIGRGLGPSLMCR